MAKKVEYTTFRNQSLFCLNCGGEHKLVYPMPIKEMTAKIYSFNVLHKNCKKTWIEPIMGQDKTEYERANFWISNGETGMSSKTIWSCMMGVKDLSVHHPYDPDDFSRCYKLLQQVLEWKSKLHKLKSLSKEWSNLVDNWDKLTSMYEENVKTDWKDCKKIGMGEFMYSLIK